MAKPALPGRPFMWPVTKSTALEVAGTGVRVNVVESGTTDTGMLTRFTDTAENKAALVSTVPVKRLANPEEIAHVIAFVASPLT
jgi:NAD(P)-dependent dehydrogenase (short-subunit alcohol dehydrogenase family)